MKWISRALAVVFALAGLAIGAFTIKLAMDNQTSLPRLLTPAQDAQDQVIQVMDAACAGDFFQVEALLYGQVDLGVRPSQTQVGQLLWQAHVDSLSYRLVGDCYPTDQGLSQQLEVTYLLRSSVTASLRSRSQAFLQQAVENAQDLEEIYDDQGGYREDVVMALVYRACQEALAEDAEYCTQQITVDLIYADGRWQVVADEGLINALSGGITG